MRLIDADKLKNSIDKSVVCTGDELLEFIDKQPPVEAIPVKFLERYIDWTALDDKEKHPWGYYADAFINDWRKNMKTTKTRKTFLQVKKGII